MPFAKWLAQQRNTAHLTQAQMAERCGVSTRQYRRWEGARCRPRNPQVYRIAETTEIHEEVVFELLDHPDGMSYCG
ncbi:MAG: helix-turn-helix transcriptional regulator [Armatimonadota bacterium]